MCESALGFRTTAEIEKRPGDRCAWNRVLDGDLVGLERAPQWIRRPPRRRPVRIGAVMSNTVAATGGAPNERRPRRMTGRPSAAGEHRRQAVALGPESVMANRVNAGV